MIPEQWQELSTHCQRNHLGGAKHRGRETLLPTGTGDISWATWNLYHLSYGCLLWFDATADATALSVATKIGDCLVKEINWVPKNTGGLLFLLLTQR